MTAGKDRWGKITGKKAKRTWEKKKQGIWETVGPYRKKEPVEKEQGKKPHS